MVIKYYIKYICNNCKTTVENEINKDEYDSLIGDCVNEIRTRPPGLCVHNCFTKGDEFGFAYPVCVFTKEE